MNKRRKKVNIQVLLKRSLLCVLVAYICYLFVAQQFDLSRLAKEGKSLDSQIAEQQQIHEELAQQKEVSGTPEYVERVARDKLGYMKPEEKVFIDAKKQ